MERQLPRGMRNHNPLNVRLTDTPWRGRAEKQTDKDFVQFVSDEYGYRAALVIMRTYIKTHKLSTPRAIISRWAPQSENNTEAYVQSACKRAGLKPNETIRWEEKNKICRLAWAMAWHENGVEQFLGVIENAYEMAKH